MALTTAYPFDFLFPQNGADAMNVPRHHRQRDVAFESNDAPIRTAIKAMYLKCVDRRLDRRVLATRLDEVIRVLDGVRLLRQLALPRQRHQFQMRLQSLLVCR